MGGAQIGTVQGVKNVIRSFSSSDLTIMSDIMVPESFTDNITQIGGINATTPVLVVPDQTIIQNDAASSPINDSSTVLAIDPASYPKVMSMTFSSDTPSNVFSKLKSSGTIILTSPLAQSLNVTVGDQVKIRVMTYVYNYPVLTWQNFTVVGVAQGAWLNIMSFGNFMLSEASYISYNSLNATFPTHSDYNDSANLFFVKVNANTNIGQTKNNIMNSYGNKYQLSVTTYNDAVQRVESSINQIFYILYSVVAFAVLNAGIGVAAIMIMNVSERRREIGIYRSQGMSKSQVVTSIIGEAAFLGAVGFAMGVAVGLMFDRVTVSYMQVAGFPMAFTIPVDAIAVMLVLAILTAVISAVYPADRASKQNIVDAIRS
jgi:putative ABC transport system permease protein